MEEPENHEPGSDAEPEKAPEAPGGEGSDPTVAADEPDPTVDEAELRRRIEEGLRDVRVQDVLLESVVTFINLTARRIGKADERDLEQARVGVEAVRALVGLLEPEPQAQVRNALSELQMLYAQHAEGDGGGEAAAPPPAEEPPPRTGEAGPGLWTPPGS